MVKTIYEELSVVQGVRVGGCHNVRPSPARGETVELTSEDEKSASLAIHRGKGNQVGSQQGLKPE